MRWTKVVIPVVVVVVIAAIVIPIAVVFTRSDGAEGPLVNTAVGMIRGVRAEDGTAMFLGIPYARLNPENRFGAAIPNPIFENVYNAFNDDTICPQLASLQDMVDGSRLDCLQLSIHVPQTDDKSPLPVFVYIHGGGFNSGSSGLNSFGPKYLIRHKVIFVALNYRLGVYGFMCLRTAQVPGNQGLKDQLLALRWIKNNIKSFGGDVDSITIAGDSAGGMSVDSQLLFAEEGLFHKVIILSGTSLTPTAYPQPDLNAALKISRRLGFNTPNTDEAIAFLTNRTPLEVLVAAQVSRILFRPCVEREFPNVERFATSHPVSAPMTKAKNIPLIAGYTEDEWLIPYLNMSAQAFETLDIFNENIRSGFDFGANHDAMKLLVRRFYVGDEPMSIKLRRAVIDFDSDFRFNHPTQRSLKKYLEYGGVAYHYVFSYIGGRNMQRVRFNITEGGATHADDLGYFLEMPDLRDVPTTPDDDLMVDRITTLWTNFAKFGNPTPSTTNQLPVQWLPITRDNFNFLNLTLDLQLSTRPFHRRLSFLDDFYHANREYVRGQSTSLLK